MPVESWMMPDDVPGLAAQATDRIDAVLARLGEAERAAFWASVRKCYNTPYNDPKPRALPTLQVLPLEVLPLEILPLEILPLEPPTAAPIQATAGSTVPERSMPMAAISAAGFAVEAHAS